MSTVVVAGNPKPDSRTLDAAARLAARLDPAPHTVVDIVSLGAGLLGWGDQAVAQAKALVQSASLVIVASPTFKATYSGILKLFLDQFETATGLAGVTAVPLMLGAGPGHALAPELLLRPVLVELGASCPAPAVYQLDRGYLEDPALDAWVERWGPLVRRSAGIDGAEHDDAGPDGGA